MLLLLQGVSDGCQPLISREYGRGNAGEARAVRNLSYVFALVVAAVCTAGMFFVRGSISGVFGASEEVSAEVGRILPVFMAGFVFVAVSRISTAYFYATGDVWRAYVVIYGEPLCLLALLFVLPAFFGIGGTWASVPLSQALLAVVAALLVIFSARKGERAVKTEQI